MDAKTICLNMIVKDESHIIIDTLKNLCSYIKFDYWVISDTGSSDNTKELITNFFKEKCIQGELLEHKWVDFAHNRTKALECAFNKTDFLFIFDADDSIVGNFKLPVKYDCDSYKCKFGKVFAYLRPLLITNRKKWHFKGVLHEFLENIDAVGNAQTIEGDYHFVSGRSGNRNKNPNKYIDDATILKDAHFKVLDSDYGLSCRYAFYCAQSYKDAGDKYMDDAIEWYKKCLTLNMWVQEKYYSCLCIGDLYMKKKDTENALNYWYKTIEHDIERIEGIVHAVNYLRNNGQNLLVNALYHKFKNYKKKPEDKLFLLQSLYNDQLEYENVISSYYINDKESGYECCKKIIFNNIIPYNLLKSTISNLNHYKDFLLKETNENLQKLFYAIDNILCDISLKNETIEENIITIWTTLFEKIRPLLFENKNVGKTLVNKNKSKSHKSNLKTIMITFTTCKRLDLFKQTIGSILNHWTDINKIDYWFCVDDNSSENDRKEMLKLYPWINFHMKPIKEKGHLKSMNIIWNKLNEFKPKYWIHMEDDFLFHHKTNYIETAIDMLKNDISVTNKVKQVLFNRNYGETISSYNTKGHINTSNNNIVLHNYCNGTFNYVNCHYWPHYSFRPSLIETDVILELGNFDSEKQFFEMEYAYKWANAGYKSAFFNRISCQHIGRLTSERNDKNIKNAYELNDEAQFNDDSKKNTNNKINKIKIINLERRKDRKEKIVKNLTEAQIETNTYEFITATDWKTLKPTHFLKDLFQGNDFRSNGGAIGCALSHYNLWKQLMNDKDNEYYLIMEDDFTLCPNFKEKLDKLIKDKCFLEKDVIFLGYHMFEKYRKQNFDTYNVFNDDSYKIVELNQKFYIGGYFSYSINKAGAKKLLDYIEKNGIKHGIDYLNKIIDNLNNYECQPQLVFSEWNEDGKQIDTDIQNICNEIDFTNIVEENTNQIKINTSFFHRGRLGNLFFVNMALHFIAKKNNLHVGYQENKKLKQLGIELFIGKKTYNNEDTIALSDDNFFSIITGEPINKNVSIVNDVWCQTNDFSNYLRTHFDEEQNKLAIINNNLYKERYNNNNDVFIHLRLGDSIRIPGACPTYNYYEKILSSLTFDNGYISSDSIDYYLCKKLINKYNLKVINYDEVNTIMFGSTCKHIILSSGTFSWLIGFFGFYSEIYYPKIVNKWHGDIFVFKSWNEIEYDKISDNDLQKKFTFIPKLDIINNDMYYHKQDIQIQMTIAYDDDQCIGFNTLGFFKNKIDVFKSSGYFKESDGFYVKTELYNEYLNKINDENNKNNKDTIRIKMLCNWNNSKQLCKEWSNMCENNFKWNDYELVWTDVKEDIDYYVIINYPPENEYYDPKRTILFQMEPWVKDNSKPWGIKTWGKWAEPDPNNFLAVRGRKSDCHNNVQWQLELTLDEFNKPELFEKDKDSIISSICSSKYFDEGHIARVDFLKFLEEKGDVLLDIYGEKNKHGFKNYRRELPVKNKSDGYKSYKYYFIMENNFEDNYITEKLWEPILCESLVFYYGCPNITDYIDSNAFVLLDITDFEKSYQIIKQAIKEDWWSQRIDIIRREKQKILNEMAFFPTIDKIISKNIMDNKPYKTDYEKYFPEFINNNNNNNKKYCFIHSCNLQKSGLNVLNKIILKLTDSDAINHFDKIFIVNIGLKIYKSNFFRDKSKILYKLIDKIKIINYSENPLLFEIQTIN